MCPSESIGLFLGCVGYRGHMRGIALRRLLLLSVVAGSGLYYAVYHAELRICALYSDSPMGSYIFGYFLTASADGFS